MSAHNANLARDLRLFGNVDEQGNIVDASGNKFMLQDDGSLLLVGGEQIKEQVGTVIKMDDPNYEAYATNLLKDAGLQQPGMDGNEAFINEFAEPPAGVPAPPTPAQFEQPGKDLDPSRVLERQEEIDKALMSADPETKKIQEAARREELTKAQRRQTGAALGTAAALEVANILLTMMPTATDRFAKEEIERLRKEMDEPLVKGEQMALIQENAKQNAARVGALAREQRMRSEAAQAASGGITSAAERTRLAREESRRVDEGQAEAARQESADLGRALQLGMRQRELDQRRLTDAIGFVGAREAQKRAAVSTGLTAFGGELSKVMAQQSVQDPGIVNPLFDQAKKDGEVLSVSDANKISRQIRMNRNLTEEELQEILNPYGLTASNTLINEFVRGA